MRCLVLGTGSIGLRHCRNLAGLGHEVVAWDPDGARREEAAAIPGVAARATLDQALDTRPGAAFVCAPPAHHVPLAWRALAGGAHLFVEKPIAHESGPVPALLAEAARQDRRLAVGLNLRALPSLARVRALVADGRVGRVLGARAEFGAYLPDWRPGRDYRGNYAVSAALGGGILLDAIHELDLLGWLLGEAREVLCTAEHLSDLAGDTEDWAEITVRLRSGALAHVHLDYVHRPYRRGLEVVGADGSLLWDYPAHTVTVHGEAGEPEVEGFAEVEGDANWMYVEEVRRFVRCVETGEPPLVDGREALRSLCWVEAARRSAREGRWVEVTWPPA